MPAPPPPAPPPRRRPASASRTFASSRPPLSVRLAVLPPHLRCRSGFSPAGPWKIWYLRPLGCATRCSTPAGWQRSRRRRRRADGSRRPPSPAPAQRRRSARSPWRGRLRAARAPAPAAGVLDRARTLVPLDQRAPEVAAQPQHARRGRRRDGGGGGGVGIGGVVHVGDERGELLRRNLLLEDADVARRHEVLGVAVVVVDVGAPVVVDRAHSAAEPACISRAARRREEARWRMPAWARAAVPASCAERDFSSTLLTISPARGAISRRGRRCASSAVAISSSAASELRSRRPEAPRSSQPSRACSRRTRFVLPPQTSQPPQIAAAATQFSTAAEQRCSRRTSSSSSPASSGTRSGCGSASSSSTWSGTRTWRRRRR